LPMDNVINATRFLDSPHTELHRHLFCRLVRSLNVSLIILGMGMIAFSFNLMISTYL